MPVRELAETTGASGRSSGVRIVDAFEVEVEVEVEMSAQFEPLDVGRCQQNREGAGIHFCAPARPQAIPYLPFREVMLERPACGSSTVELELGGRVEPLFVGRVERQAEAFDLRRLCPPSSPLARQPYVK